MNSGHYLANKSVAIGRLKGARNSLAALAIAAAAIGAAATDISPTPLATLPNVSAKPNIMFIMDASGSMASPYMPDDAQPQATETYAYRASQCNGLAFDPTQTYSPPLYANGTSYPNVSFTAAPVDGYNTAATANESSSTSVTIGTGSKTFFLGGNNLDGIDPGMPVRISRSSDSSKWMEGTVNYWSRFNSRQLIVNVTSTSGSTSSYNNWTVALLNTANLTNEYYFNYSTGQAPLSWTYNTSGLITTTFSNECRSAVGSSPGSTKFTKVTVSAALQQNYANWYSYYRTRVLLMRTSVGKSFVGLDSTLRVGFTTIDETSVTPGAKFLDVADFDATQKSLFITKLYGAVPNNSTPLRAALSKTGRYFAKKVSGQTYDPMQYSCQRNFAILSTDGYWNNNDESSSYNPVKLDGSTLVGQQDGTEAKPMHDGAAAIVTTTSTYSTTATTITTVNQPQKQIITDTTTTTTTTPTSWARTNQSLGTTNPNSTKTNSNITRTCSGSSPNISCTVTVTTSTNHNVSTGNKVLIAGVTPSAYNGGPYNVASTPNSTTLTYVLSGLSSTPATPTNGNRGTSVETSSTYGNCPAGQGTLTSTPQTGNGTTVSTSSAIVTTTNNRTKHDVTTNTVVTPHTHTVVTTDGVVTSNTDVAGSATTTNVADPTTYVTGATTTANSSAATGPTVNQPSSWTSGTATTSCAASAPAITPTQTGSSGASNSTAPVVNVTGAWANNGSATSTPVVQPLVTSAEVVGSTVNSSSGGSSDSLADVAEYYYATDLRTSALGNCTSAASVDLCDNILTSGSGLDSANWQHMTTYTIGLGVSGTLTYDPNYLSQTAGDYVRLKQGVANWPQPGDGLEAVNIDDLWHAAVNGRGKYFAAKDATGLSTAISGALAAAGASVGSGSSAAVSTLSLVNGGDNQAYLASYTTLDWTGDVTAHTVTAATGAVDTTTSIWSARTQLEAVAASARTIYYLKPGTATLAAFNYTNLAADGYGGYFSNFCSQANVPLQCASLSSGQVTGANTGDNLVNFLRGDKAYEAGTNSANPYYRTRQYKLGDFVNASPVYVQKPRFSYVDAGYSAHVSANSSRMAMVYAAGNDGMLHAFSAEPAATSGGIAPGTERWAYVPSMVMSKMYRLADANYTNNHQFYVDGTPVVGDIKVGSVWKTILVGGLNDGGQGYYALDITNPASPQALWEFKYNASTNPNVGLSYGNPIITKRADGTWVVVVTSGYNNSAGDGLGHLYVLNANTGAVLQDLATTAGSSANPSGLAKINGWVEDTSDNTSMRFYGGDLLGNLWRFDTDNRILPSGNEATLLANFTVTGTAQPITTIPKTVAVTSGSTEYPVVIVGTGKYLGTSDITTTTQQSIYAIKDTLAATGWGDIRASPSPLVTKTVTLGSNTSTISTNTVDWSTKAGWLIDLPTTRERLAVDMEVQFNTLAAVTTVPGGNVCSPSGSSWLYLLNIANGTASGADPVSLGNFIAAGITWIQTSGGDSKLEISGEVVNNKPTVRTTAVGSSAAAGGTVRRTSWRELVN